MANQQLSTNTFGTAKWIVSPTASDGTHTTIGGALTAASSGDTIFIRPGTYTENPTLKAGVNLTAYDCDALTPNVIINGKCTFSSAGTVSISGIQLQTNSDYFLSVTGSAASIVRLTNCNLNCLNNTGINYSTSSGSASIAITFCAGNTATTGISLFSHSSAGSLLIYYSAFANTGSSTTASTISSGVLGTRYAAFPIPITTSGTSLLASQFTTFAPTNATALTAGGSGSHAVDFGHFIAGTASAISVGSSCTLALTNSEINSSNTDAITGSGTLNYGGIDFYGTSSTINTTTQNPIAYSVPQGGTGGTSHTAYALLAGGTTSTGSLQSLAGLGSSGQVLTSNGAAALPTFQAATSGAMTLLLTQTASNSASIAFSSTYITSTYNNYMVIFDAIIPVSNSVNMNLTVSTNNGSTYVSTGYNAGATNFDSAAAAINGNTNSNVLFPIIAGLGNTASLGGCGYVYIYNVSNSNDISTNGANSFPLSGHYYYTFTTGNVTTTGINNIRFNLSSGNISSGTFSLYGISS